MGAQAIAQTLWGAMRFGGASDRSNLSGISTAEAAAILGFQNVFDHAACVRVLGTAQIPRREAESVPFSANQLKRLKRAFGGKCTLFVRYASLEQVDKATKSILTLDRIVLDTVPKDERESPRIPGYRLVLSELSQDEEVGLRRFAHHLGLSVAQASVTTGVTAVLLQMSRESRQSIGFQSVGQKAARQVVVGMNSSKVSVHLAQTLRKFPSILEVRARS